MIKAFKDITEAWEILGDPDKRAEYDKTHLPLLEKSNLRNLWGKVAGFNTAKTAEPQKHRDDPPDTRAVVEITLRESIKGCRKPIKVEDNLPCQNCVGKKPVDRTKCGSCRGAGIVRADRVEEVDITPGVHDRQELRLAKRGKMDGRSQRYGDLVIELQVAPHPYFSVMGKDVSCALPVTVYEAVLGGEIEAPTPTGRVTLKIQPLTQNKKVYRLKGLGLGLGVDRGDLLISVDVMLPSQLHADEVELFRKLLNVSSQPNPRAEIFARLTALITQQGNNNNGPTNSNTNPTANTRPTQPGY